MTYFIIKRAVGPFLHGALLPLVPYLNGHHWVDVLAHQLPGLGDGDGDLRHKTAFTPLGCLSLLFSLLSLLTRGCWVGGAHHLLGSFEI